MGRKSMLPLAVRPRFIAMTIGAMLVSAPALGQGTFPPSSFKNLQVLPKEATARVVVATMKGFANNLGVRCQFCHIGEEGLPLEKFDFVSDEKTAKQTARVMMRLTADINRQLDAAVALPAESEPRVTCITCHRGKSKPTNLREP
jgi:hypothetical protein